VAQIALWLALRAGQTDLLDDVERLIRARLLPSQIVDPKQPRRDGAWGVYGHPFGYGAILDVFAAVLHSLADVHEHIVTTSQEGVTAVNLHFDIETPAVSVKSQRAEKALLTIVPKQDCALRIRVPSWASHEAIKLHVGDQPVELAWAGSYLALSKEQILGAMPVRLEHDLPLRQTIEEMPVSHRKFQLNWRGDEVVSCDPRVPIYAS
jgi:hypothetical protein